MLVIELGNNLAEELQKALDGKGYGSTLIKEERLTGDASSAMVIVETSTAVINFLAATLSVWSAGSAIRARVGTSTVDLGNKSEAEIASALKSEAAPSS